MARDTETLPVVWIPEDDAVATVREDVIHLFREGEAASATAFHTQGVSGQVGVSRLAPTAPIETTTGTETAMDLGLLSPMNRTSPCHHPS
jgi:hypothetical protein